MAAMVSALTFLGGALATAIVQGFVSRVFGAPRLDAAISDMSLSRTKHRAHRSIPVSDSLRLLLSDGPTSHVNWDARFVCEHDIDLSVLELIDEENNYQCRKTESERLLGTLTPQNARQSVISLGLNVPLIEACVNALIQFAGSPKVPKIPDTRDRSSQVFGVVVKKRERDGQNLEFIHLDLPGNPFPVVGSPGGRPENNANTAPFVHAMSHCDSVVLAGVLSLTVDFCDWRIGQIKKLKDEFRRIKREKTYLEIRVSAANRGQVQAYLSPFAEVSVGASGEVVKMSYVDDTPQGVNPRWQDVIRDDVRRLAEWLGNVQDELRLIQGTIENIAIPTSGNLNLHFVSDNPVSQDTIDAVNAMLRGYANCSLVLWQYVPRRLHWLPWKARFVRRTKTLQRLTAVRSSGVKRGRS